MTNNNVTKPAQFRITAGYYKSRIRAMNREIKKAENLLKLQQLMASTEARLDSTRRKLGYLP